jgi:hypothetical protein
MHNTKTDLIGHILTTARADFFRHALPMGPDEKPGPMAAAFLSAAITRAETVAAMLGHSDPKRGAYDVIGTTPGIVAGLKNVLCGAAGPAVLDDLKKAQKHHLSHRRLADPMMEHLTRFHDPRALPDLAGPKIGFGN